MEQDHQRQPTPPGGETQRYLPIGDYAIVGDARTAALVSRYGSIDWLCLPDFDGPSVFARLIDHDRGGYFSIQPAVPFAVARSYLNATNVLETEFTTAGGRVRMRDFMPALSEDEKRNRLFPLRQMVRCLEGLEGSVPLRVDFSPRPQYGAVVPTFTRLLPGLYRAEWGAQALHLGTGADLAITPDGVRGQIIVNQGEQHDFVLGYAETSPAVLPVAVDARHLLERTIAYWQRWVSTISYRGPYADQVIRSGLALKLLSFAPSGAIIAAPTTSLPENPGGERNWDYRFCWLRDASLTLRALLSLGCHEEADAFVGWMLHTTRLTQPRLQAVYDIYGESRLTERELSHLEGHEGSRPVRIGNGAYSQTQMDVYGEVLSAIRLWTRYHGRLDGDTRGLIAGMADYVAAHWHEPDEGLWEIRSGKKHHVHSKALCCVALENAATILSGPEYARRSKHWRAVARAIRTYVYTKGFSARLNAYTRSVGGSELDASLLQLPLVGFEDPNEPRMRSTIMAILERLTCDGGVYRYLGEDGLPGAEGAFIVCGFWLVQCLAKMGRVDEAARWFERLQGWANDVGLLAEEVDPATGALLGNFPQGFSHIGLIDAAVALAEAGHSSR